MLSLQQAYEVQASILEYLKATFTFREKGVGEAFRQFVEDEQNGLFKGPYLSLKLPFEKGAADAVIPLTIQPPFPPFDHQLQAFRRLTSRDEHEPQPTILTTGTGSGKTESFLYPLLDYCHQQEERPGIKCIILYPMNALATDQAARLAKAIHGDARLKGHITAGLFIGLGRDGKRFPKDMGADHIIENRDSILDAPPDILLTNFKMLDYALMRNQFHGLWRHNLEDPSLLRFLVLDELHTYDGAQGTDVANLIRRLKLKLNLEPGQLCPVGTSATIGSGADAPRLLSEYASQVFGEAIGEDAIITEKRVETEDFFGASKSELYNRLPSKYKLQFSMLQAGEDYQTYLERQLDLWQINPRIKKTELGAELKSIRLVWDIVELCSRQLLTVSELIRKLDYLNEEFRKIPEWDAEHQFNPKESVIRSLLSLIAEAKTASPVPGGTIELPFLYLQVQMWIRELSGILRVLSPEPVFTWRDKLEEGEQRKALPAYFCRECGASGWLAVKHDNRNKLEDELGDIYARYFSNHKNIFFVNNDEAIHQPVAEYRPTEMLRTYLNPYSLHLHDREGPGRMPVVAYRVVNKNYNVHLCPACNTRNTLNIIGMRTSSLASVTTSQVLATDLNPQTEKDRKLLAFANGVQDAAHLAGFVEARNYRFSLRTSLQKVVNSFDRPVSLADLQEAFINYWKAEADERGDDDLEAYIYKFFPSDRVGDVSLYAYRQRDGSYAPVLTRELDERIRWEIASEFGYNAVIGRTLEKTGSSAVFFEQDSLKKAYAALEPWMENNLMGRFAEPDFLRFVNGFLHRLRLRGGIAHPYLDKYRTRDLKLWDLNWMNDKRHFLNRRFGPKTRLPKLITDLVEKRGLLDSTNTKQENWYHAYLKKSFTWAPYHDAVNEFYTQLLNALTEVEVLDEASAGGMRNFCLRPEAVRVENQVSVLECDQCGHRLSVGATAGESMRDAKCLQYNCTGDYRETSVAETDNYYRQVYNRRRAPRIYATDHTGLLERSDREQKERDFKERPRFNSLNALVATSTLEMGIDIGDLNVTMNSNVPPLPANFLQRIGRAGRKSGSALILNFVSNKPHDLFYYEDPRAMMEGDVHTPGCYLDARDILKRHFFAFCIDSWTLSNPQKNSIPVMVRLLKLASVNLDDPQFFVNRLLSYVKVNEQSLLDRFQSMYAGQVDEEIFRELRETMVNEQFYRFPRRVFEQLQEEYRQLRQRRRDLKQYLNEKQLGQEDDERKELEKEIRNIWGAIKALEKRQVLEHMTNVGLLPNYAFPETGVTLNARIMGFGGEESKDIELVRPASQAIKELIPDNLFYTQGYKLKISGLNVVDWKESATNLRYCGFCDHILEDAKTGEKACPKCGHESWSSAANRHRFLRLEGVKSFNDRASATLDDSTDDRESAFTFRTRHFRFYPEASHGAYAIRKVPFGIEYVREVDLLEVNAGVSGEFIDRNRITSINGEEVPVAGYVTCRFCGRSSSQLQKVVRNRHEPKEARDFHYAYCKFRDQAYAGKADDVFEEVYLYREMKTEALKVLLPVQEFESDSGVSMFKAGIELGLRRYYQGNPQHIRAHHYAEFNFQTLKMDRYLVLYDVIPGGTGYLEKLFDVREFRKVLQLAYEGIRDCVCQHHGKDGCYRCIYSYSNQFDQRELSRKKAERQFEKIIKLMDTWDHLPQGLGKVTNTGQIEESELEDRFIRALRNFTRKDPQQERGWAFEEVNRDGVVCYRLLVKEAGNEFQYFIQPQYRLGPAQGVAYVTIADFLIRCEKALVGGRELTSEELLAIKPIAVYLDGYQYHGSSEHPRFVLDIEKRSAILASNQYLCWTLSWDDVAGFEEQTSDVLAKIVRKNTKVKDQLRRHPKFKSLNGALWPSANNFSRLIWILENAQLSTHLQDHFHLYLMALQEVFGRVRLSEEHLRDHFRTGTPLTEYPQDNDRQGNSYFQIPIPTETDRFKFRVFLRLRDFALGGGVKIRHRNEGFPKVDWDTFWKVFNLIQLNNPRIWLEEELEEAPASEEQTPSTSATDESEILSYYDEEYHLLVRQLLEKGIEFSRDGSFVLMDKRGEVWAEAILGLEDRKVVFEPLSEECEKRFVEKGYTIEQVEGFEL